MKDDYWEGGYLHRVKLRLRKCWWSDLEEIDEDEEEEERFSLPCILEYSIVWLIQVELQYRVELDRIVVDIHPDQLDERVFEYNDGQQLLLVDRRR